MGHRVKHAFFVLLAALLGLSLCSCSKDVKTDLPELHFLAYTGENQNNWQAHELRVDLLTQEINLNSDIVYEVTDEHGWSDIIFPMELTNDLLVLRGEPSNQPNRSYVICPKEEYLGEYKIWKDHFSLTYNPKNFQAVIKKDNEMVGTLNDLNYEGIALYPIAFFIDDENKLVIMCDRGNEESSWDENYPIGIVASLKSGGGKTYFVEKIQPFDKIFSDELSKMKSPSRNWFTVNIYGDTATKSFYWNETRSIVKMNPYTGEYETVIDEQQVKKDMPFIDTHRESYDFFTGFSVQENVYIALFPNYNDVYGTYAALYSDESKFLGCVLCTEASISYLNSDGEKIKEINNEKLRGLLYAPVVSKTKS